MLLLIIVVIIDSVFIFTPSFLFNSFESLPLVEQYLNVYLPIEFTPLFSTHIKSWYSFWGFDPTGRPLKEVDISRALFNSISSIAYLISLFSSLLL